VVSLDVWPRSYPSHHLPARQRAARLACSTREVFKHVFLRQFLWHVPPAVVEGEAAEAVDAEAGVVDAEAEAET